MKPTETGRTQLMAVFAACGLLICLTLIPIIQYQMASRPAPLTVIYE
jgi:hypothetical protein